VTRRTAWLAALVVAALELVPGAVLPQPARPAAGEPSPQQRAKARKLAGEALDLFAAGDFAAALARFEAADAIVPAPTLKLHIARCLDKLDRMLDAAEKYREVIAAELPPNAPAVHREARDQAVPELAKLLDHIPELVVVVRGAGSDRATLEMEGVSLPREAIGERQKLDPGAYSFSARSGDARAHERVVLERGQKRRLVLELPRATGDAPPVEQGNTVAVVGWALVGLGGAGLVVGAITGGAVLAEEDDLLGQCPDRACPPAAHDDARAFDRLRITSTVGFVVGGVAGAVGATLLVLDATGGGASDEPPRAQGRIISLRVGAGAERQVQLTARF
jgi:hypothetical protein